MKSLLEHKYSERKDYKQHNDYQAIESPSHRNKSNIKFLLSDPIAQNQRKHNSVYQIKALTNPITQQNKLVKIPKISKIQQKLQQQPISNRNIEVQKLTQIMRKFSKPYSQCTKYIDNLSQHQKLIRRGPFNIPLDKNNILTKYSANQYQKQSRQKQLLYRPLDRKNIEPNETQSSRIKSISYSLQGPEQRYKKYHKNQSNFKSSNNLIKVDLENNKYLQKSLHQNQRYSNKLMTSINAFDKSLQSQFNNYKNLMKKQRNYKQQNIVLKNSVNKLVAIDLIKQKINANSMYTKNNLAKLQKKFKKKKQFISKDLQN